MKKDIPVRKVKDIAVAIVPEKNVEEALWEVYLINYNDYPLKNVLINSKGSGIMDGEEIKTSTLRHFFEHIDAQSYIMIEPIQAEVFRLTNEYWISFQHDGFLFDKRYTFVPGSIAKEHFTTLPFLKKDGVVIGG